MNCDEKLNIILDLDNTLISSLSFKEWKKLANKKDVKNLRYTDMEDYYRIFHRPYLQEFLDFLFSNFNVTVWTAASKDYCMFIVKNILMKRLPYESKFKSKNPRRQFKYICYDKNCEESEMTFASDSPKDLRYLYDFEIGYYPCNTIIIDDLIHVYKANEGRTIRADYFDASKNSDDDFLLRTIDDLKEIKKNYEHKCCIHNIDGKISSIDKMNVDKMDVDEMDVDDE